MLEILGITLPIFLIVAIGFAAVRWGYFEKSDVVVLGKFVINVALPALLFKSLAERPFGEVVNGKYIFDYALASLLVFALGFTLAYLREGRHLEVGALRGMGMSFSNSAFIGYPVLLQFVGSIGGVAVAMCMVVETLIMLPLTLLLAEIGAHNSGSFSRHDVSSLMANVFKERLLKNPLILFILIALIFSASGLSLPPTLTKSIDLLAGASSPLALFVIGGMLVGIRAKTMVLPVSQVLAGKLVLHPLLVFAMLWLVPVRDPVLRKAAIVVASMPMLSIYPVLGQRYKQGDICSVAMLMTTALSFVSISCVLWLLETLALP